MKNKLPVLIEAFNYRFGDHSTSDSAVGYRKNEQVNLWKQYVE